METKAEKIAVLSNIILHKAERIKELKLECGRQATKICVLELRVKELEADVCPAWMGKEKGCNEARDVVELHDQIAELEAENKKLIEGQQARLKTGS